MRYKVLSIIREQRYSCPDQSEDIAKFGCDTCKNSLDHCKARANQTVTPPATEPTPTESQTSTPDMQAAAKLDDPAAAKPAAAETAAAEPAVAKPAVAEPAAAKPPAAEPLAAETPAAEPPAAGLPLVKHLTKTTYRRPKPITKSPKPCPCHGKKGPKHAVIIPGCAETTKFTKNHHRYRGRKHRRPRPQACTC
ncbi:BZ3500_MvSof-1268-A1-R1_Chr7-1g09100 [Microbotryum saponariae]|uniref:BZ3500_MvSof-1268-A1-R1_Chr7-1g09100 protein n=1 Tax=Microbotryum saponariae TaxID=289078 RepID=A0A2X0N191_9BASI|nr:BZ3501_MvSof-1269-A2-R1_Chr7-1g08805 [Microbotryum saponariae]SDA02803.1 BZ3500_MvSof-1268-A1-R1_Chr7-1g09100 [Microbotryum saponariae]